MFTINRIVFIYLLVTDVKNVHTANRQNKLLNLHKHLNYFKYNKIKNWLIIRVTNYPIKPVSEDL